MQLTNNEIKVKDIMLDPFNPRFIKQSIISQTELLNKILETRDAKEIMTSMQKGIKWVNRIVVQSLDDLSDQRRKEIKDIEKFKYIIVEGNTRLACLKSGKINSITKETTIPVLVAQFEENESKNEFQNELLLTQGIANIMVVKEWKPLAKARHLYYIFLQKKEMYNSDNFRINEIFKEISNELGVKSSEVRTGIIRYAIFNEISKESDTIDENNWPYLEAFDHTEYIRSKFGMIKNSIKFEWDEEENYPESTEKHDLLNDIPSIINSAIKEGIPAKRFRDIFKKFINDKESIEEIKLEIEKITDVNEDISWKEIRDEMDEISEEEKWKNELSNIFRKLDNFPSAADWANNHENSLNKIKSKIEKHLRVIEISNE